MELETWTKAENDESPEPNPGAREGTGKHTDSRQEKRTRLALALLRKRLDKAHSAGETVLKLGPEDLRRLCSEAGVKSDAVEAFRALVRSNLVRLRGRWREGVSGVTSPVYVARLAERESRDYEDPRQHATRFMARHAKRVAYQSVYQKEVDHD